MFKFLALFLLISTFALNAAEYDMRKTLGKNNELFSVSLNYFVSKNPMFQWVSFRREAARYSAAHNPQKATFLGFPVYEAIVSFSGNKPSKFYISIYNRGDAGEMEYNEFEELVESFNSAITKITGVKGEEQDGQLANNMTLNVNFRVAGKYLYTVKWSVSGRSKRDRKPEYLQLEIEPFNPKDDPRKKSVIRVDRTNIKSSENLTANVKREPDGTVWIDNIPMVDQGAKGYCVAAVAERIMRYYGIEEVNMHSIAQITGTTNAGTSTETMLNALNKAGSKFGIRVRSKYSAEIETIEELSKIISKYNNLARKAKKKKIKMVQRGNVVYLGETMMQMDPKLYRRLRCQGEKREMNNFYRGIRTRVNNGLPTAWCVMLGLVNEKQKTLQLGGGHMRLIIGYNDRENSIVYTDTWGAGHELKTMPLEDAWTMTMRTITINPRQSR